MSFVENGDSNPPADPPADISSNSFPGEESVSISLIGSRKAVLKMIQLLHCTNIIAGSEWSSPVGTHKRGEVISVATRAIQTE